jgi:hypothetical protein
MGQGCPKGWGCSKVQHEVHGAGIGIGIERFLRIAFDSDGDTDAHTDACRKGSRTTATMLLVAVPKGSSWR